LPDEHAPPALTLRRAMAMARRHPALSALPPRPARAAQRAGEGGRVDAGELDEALGPPRARWMQWQRRALVLVALLGCLGIFALVRSLAASPYIDVLVRPTAQGSVEMVSSPIPQLQGLAGARLGSILGSAGQVVRVDDNSLLRSPRWSVVDLRRESLIDTQERLGTMLRQGDVTLRFDGEREIRLSPGPRGYAGLGALFWLICAMALSLYLVAAVVVLVRPSLRNWLYLAMGFSQSANLLAIGIESIPGLGLPPGFASHSLLARMGFDLITSAALVHTATLLPLRLPGGRWIAAATWAAMAVLLGAAAGHLLSHVWWWTQAAALGCGLLAVAMLSWSYRIEPNPFAVLMRRIATVAEATLLLLSVAVAAASLQPGIPQGVVSVGTVIWYLFLASLLLLMPFLSRRQQLLREFAMLAGISTVAMSFDLLFVAVFSLEQFASLSLSVFMALGIYAGTRQWLLNQMTGTSVLGAERMFDRLYRSVREVEANPQQSAELLTRLLRELFEPLEVQRIERRSARSRVFGDGSALLVPMPSIGTEHEAAADGSIVLRFAGRGKRMFTRDDARLTDRVVEQLRRAVAYDHAVERGRSEERARIAQDLHDDIGARLLTLMYKAQTPEIEDYVRHTLKDLKTLTRGLAAADQRLSHATAEWKSDIAQRLTAAHIELDWSFAYDDDMVLSVVKWSALTRVLRELVSNAIQHSCATHVEIAATLEQGCLRLTMLDDGIGRDPQAWSHGLGLGGVRKRVKLLGGQVQWRENGRLGIVCSVLVPNMDSR
jgi:signal transduction histidine kinase